MLQIMNLTYSVAGRTLINDLSWAIQPGRRVALIGPNGTGKTTLLRIICGEIEPSEGKIVKPRSYRIGYLPQEEVAIGRGGVLQMTMEGQREVFALEKEIAELHRSLDSGAGDQAALLQRLGEAERRFEILGGYGCESRAKKILSGLGFSPADLGREFSDLSGGWGMRVHLARLLMQEPDLLLLDEPTNHLDLPSLEWLEQYLLQFSGSVVLVSHDRFFIDRLAQNIYELEMGGLTRYPGNYHAYERQKEKNYLLTWKKWEEQKEERERQERFVARYRYDKKRAAQVQSRIRMLEKIEVIDLPPKPPRLDFRLSVDVPSYKDVLTAEDLFFRYEEEGHESGWVLENFNLLISRGEKVAMVGVNGAGKTTLTKLISGQLSPSRGRISLGQRTRVGYYAQHQIEALDLKATVYDEVTATVAVSLVPKIREVLGIFQFTGDDVKKPVSVLSGGEKARVSLAKILLSSTNFLVMDEPTTHLDITAREALEDALSGYNGTLLLISHDRYFLDKIVGRVIELKDNSLTDYYGNYSYYMEKRKELIGADVPESEACLPGKQEENKDSPLSAQRKSKEKKRLEAEARQTVSKERNRLQKEVKAVEQEIDALENRNKELESIFASPDDFAVSGPEIGRLQKEFSVIRSRLEDLYTRWEEARLRLENLLNTIK
jgi:ATP-binding cassette subfamily F protein 3